VSLLSLSSCSIVFNIQLYSYIRVLRSGSLYLSYHVCWTLPSRLHQHLISLYNTPAAGWRHDLPAERCGLAAYAHYICEACVVCAALRWELTFWPAGMVLLMLERARFVDLTNHWAHGTKLGTSQNIGSFRTLGPISACQFYNLLPWQDLLGVKQSS
jgi:hypothetical protein